MATMNSISFRFPGGVGFAGAAIGEFVESYLSYDALQFTAKLEREFRERRRLLLRRRTEHQMVFNVGKMPGFLPETEYIRSSYWRVASIPNRLLDRRVELVGPPEKETITAAVNSGANSYIADFEDTASPTWHNILTGHVNLQEYIHGTSLTSPEGADRHTPEGGGILVMVCPRGWQAEEKHVLIDGRPISASLFDFGMFMFHNARELLSQGAGPYFYLPKIESSLEASLWNDVFLMAQDELDIPHGSIKATAVIETVPAAFEINEILFVLREHCIGLACGKWNYVFSLLKKFRHHAEFILPEYSRISTATHFLHFLSLLVIQTGHKRGAHAIGGIATLPHYTGGESRDEIAARIYSEITGNAEDGCDGTMVLNPESALATKAAFDSTISGPNQLHRKRSELHITSQDLLTVHKGETTEEGFRRNFLDALHYIAAWLNGNGTVVSPEGSIYHTATAEIARSQLWQWLHHGRKFWGGVKGGEADYYRHLAQEEYQKINKGEVGSLSVNYAMAKRILEQLVLDKNFVDFFTTTAYQYLD
ncbi:MAG: malate synthase [Bacteroidota bacterium]|nr:malate synthase [Bacteroidota bacterium]